MSVERERDEVHPRLPGWLDLDPKTLEALGQATVALGYLQFIVMSGLRQLIEGPSFTGKLEDMKLSIALTRRTTLGPASHLLWEIMEITFPGSNARGDVKALKAKLGSMVGDRNSLMHTLFAWDIEDGGYVSISLKDYRRGVVELTPKKLSEDSIQITDLAREIRGVLIDLIPVL